MKLKDLYLYIITTAKNDIDNYSNLDQYSLSEALNILGNLEQELVTDSDLKFPNGNVQLLELDKDFLLDYLDFYRGDNPYIDWLFEDLKYNSI